MLLIKVLILILININELSSGCGFFEEIEKKGLQG